MAESEWIEATGIAFCDQPLPRPLKAQPSLKPAAGWERPEAQHLKGIALMTEASGQQQVPVANQSRELVRDGGQWIRQQRPATAVHQLLQGLLIGGQVCSESPPWTCYHHPWAGPIRTPQNVRPRWDVGWARQGHPDIAWHRHARPELLLLLRTRMQRLLKRKIEMHRTGGLQRSFPGLSCQGTQRFNGQTMQTIDGTAGHPTAGTGEKVLLIDRLIGAAVFESLRAIPRQEQQGNAGTVGLDCCRQQVGDRCAGGGNHGHRPA